MPGWWIVAILFFLLAVGVLIGSVFAGQRGRLRLWGITAGAVLFGVLFTLVSAYDRVDTRNVGIITEFGKPVGSTVQGSCGMRRGARSVRLSEAIQLQAFESNSYDDASAGRGANGNPAAINVRLANNSNAYVDENLNWRLREGAAPKLFQDYGGANVFQTIKEQLVDRQAQVALSKVFATFNPQVMLAAAANAPGGTGADDRAGPGRGLAGDGRAGQKGSAGRGGHRDRDPRRADPADLLRPADTAAHRRLQPEGSGNDQRPAGRQDRGAESVGRRAARQPAATGSADRDLQLPDRSGEERARPRRVLGPDRWPAAGAGAALNRWHRTAEQTQNRIFNH